MENLRECIIFYLLFCCSNIVVFSIRIFRNSILGQERFFLDVELLN